MTCLADRRCPLVILASPAGHPPRSRHSSSRSGPAARWIAPSTPPPPSKDEFAALTIASTRSVVMSALTAVSLVAMGNDPSPGRDGHSSNCVIPARSDSLLHGPFRDNLDFHDEEGIRWNEAGDTRLPIGEVRRYTKPPSTSDPHSFHTIEESRKHGYPINAQSRGQSRTFVLESRAIHPTPWLRPANRVAVAQPHPETHLVPLVSLERRTRPRRFSEKLDS